MRAAIAHETVDPDGYAADIEPDSAGYNGTYQVTGDLNPHGTPTMSTCSRRREFGQLWDSEHGTFGLGHHGM